MTRLVKYELESGESIVIEVNDPNFGQPLPAASPGKKFIDAGEDLEHALEHVLPGIKAVVKKLRNIDGKPDEIEVNFGIKFTTIAGAIIAAASVEANLGVTLRWNKTSAENSTSP